MMNEGEEGSDLILNNQPPMDQACNMTSFFINFRAFKKGLMPEQQERF